MTTLGEWGGTAPSHLSLSRGKLEQSHMFHAFEGSLYPIYWCTGAEVLQHGPAGVQDPVLGPSYRVKIGATMGAYPVPGNGMKSYAIIQDRATYI
jgi:hypothetical protein